MKYAGTLRSATKYVIVFLTSLFAQTLSAQPTISSFSPTSGPVGTTITISGTNFDPAPANNLVFFGAVKAAVSGASPSSLTVSVPAGATYEPIKVTVSNLTAYSPLLFLLTFTGGGSNFSINSFAPKIDFTTGANPQSAYPADFDGDGKVDIAIANASSNTISILKNTSDSGSISFAPKVDYASSTYPISIFASDLDGDGKIDIVVANYNAGSISVFKNTSVPGGISFLPGTDYISGGGPIFTSVADIEADGKPDIVIVNSSSNTISILQNTTVSGTISFATKVDYPVGTNPQSVAITDLDNDNKVELAVVNATNNSVSILKNTSTGTTISFAAKIDYPTGSSPYSVAAGDLDGDGKPDLVTANGNSASLSLLRNTSSGSGSSSFTARTDIPAESTPAFVVISDLDGDGKADLATANYQSSSVTVNRNTSTSGNISFASNVRYSVGGAPIALLITDLDNDGKNDISIARSASNTISVLRNIIIPLIINSFTPVTAGPGASVTIKGTGFIGVSSISFGGTPANSFKVVSDTVIVATVGSGSTGNIMVVKGNSSAIKEGFTFVPPPAITSFEPKDAKEGTLVTIRGNNFNNITEVKFGSISASSFNVLSPNTIEAIVGGMAGGNVKISTSYGSDSLAGFYNGPVISSFLPASGPRGTTVTISGDNFSNILGENVVYFGNVRAQVTAASNNAINVTAPGSTDNGIISITYRGLTTYTSNPFITTFPPSTRQVETYSFNKADIATGRRSGVGSADLNGDGKADMVILNEVDNKIFVYKNISTNQSILFDNKIEYASSVAPAHVAFGDLNGDGKLDMVVANDWNTHSISIFKNTSTNSDISFCAKTDYFVGNPRKIMVRDLDGDGRAEVIVNSGTGSLRFFKNVSEDREIIVATLLDYSIGTVTGSFDIRDLDADKKPDIVLSNTFDAKISVFRNTSIAGAISFTAPVQYFVGSFPSEVAIGDLDGDEKPDVAVTSTDSTFHIYKNTTSTSTISFSNIGNYVTGKSTLASNIALNDINGDGKADVIIVNSSYVGSVLLYLNYTTGDQFLLSDKIAFPTGVGSRQVSVADFDLNGKPDIAIANNNGYDVSILKNQIGELLVSELCSQGSTIIKSNITGTNYHWQVNTGSGFQNINDSGSYTGSTSPSLQIKNISSSSNGFSYRCIIDGNATEIVTVKIVNRWTGADLYNSWENPANWSCGVVPDANTDVVINSGSVVLTSNASCRSLTVNPAASFIINPSYKLTIIK